MSEDETERNEEYEAQRDQTQRENQRLQRLMQQQAEQNNQIRTQMQAQQTMQQSMPSQTDQPNGIPGSQMLWGGGERHPSKSNEPFWPLLIATLLMLSDFFLTKFDGIAWDEFSFFIANDPLDIIWHIFNGVTATIFLLYAIHNIRNTRTWISFALIEIAFYTVAMFSGFNLGALLHMGFILYLYFSYVKPKAVDEFNAQITLFLFIVVDFFVISAISDLTAFPMRMVPVWFIAVLYFTSDMHRGVASKILIGFVVTVYMFGLGQEALAAEDMSSYIDQSASNDFIDFVKGAYTNAMSSWGLLKESVRDTYNRTTAVYREEYYTGTIDQNAQKELGVKLTDIERGHTEQFIDEPINIWSNIEVQTLDNQNITVKTRCIADEGEEEEREADELRPKEFQALDYGIYSIDCIFHSNTYTPGTHDFTIEAAFNFRTEAYQKIYFMDRTKYSALRVEDLDPLENYGIEDKEPKTIYTNGPIMIGISLRDTLIQVDEKDTQLILGVTFTNDWNGEVNNIENVRLTLPSYISLDGNCSGEYEFSCTGTDPVECNLENELPPFKERQTIRCPLMIEENDIKAILGESPLSIRYFRAGIDYNYTITEKTSIRLTKSKHMAELEKETAKTEPELDIPHLFLDIGGTEIVDLNKVSDDEETNDVYLYYSLTDDCDVASCSIKDNQFMNCTGLKNGSCVIDVSVNDLAQTTTDAVDITVGEGSCRWDDARCIEDREALLGEEGDEGEEGEEDISELTPNKPLEFKVTGDSSSSGTKVDFTDYFQGDFSYFPDSTNEIGNDGSKNPFTFFRNNEHVDCGQYTVPLTVTKDNGQKEFDMLFTYVPEECDKNCSECLISCCEYSAQDCHIDNEGDFTPICTQ
ncbi:MAG: hypothetical protein ACLFP2_01610 [Candidatus Woesearchaeota archaeon]